MVLADRVHPNAKAIAAVVEATLPAIDCILDREAQTLGSETGESMEELPRGNRQPKAESDCE